MRLHLGGDDIREIDFRLGQIVYLRCRDDPMRGMVTRLHVSPEAVLYSVTWGTGNETTHYAIELTAAYEPHYGHGAGPDGGDGDAGAAGEG